MYCMYTVHDPRQSALLTSERNVHLYLLYPYSDSYSILFQSFPLFLEEAFVSKIVSSAATVQTPEIFYYSLRL